VNLIQFIHELSRRRVFRLAAFYVVGAWLLLQIASVVVEPLGLPQGSMRFVVYVSVSGFFLSILLSWRYDITSRGIVRAPDALDGAAQPVTAGDYVVIIVATVVAVLAAAAYYQWVTSRPQIQPESAAYDVVYVAQLNHADTDAVDDAQIYGLMQSTLELIPSEARSIIVLPKTGDDLQLMLERCAQLEAEQGCKRLVLQSTVVGNDLQFDVIVDRNVRDTIRASQQNLQIEELCRLLVDTLDQDLKRCDLIRGTENADAQAEFLKARGLLHDGGEADVAHAIEYLRSALEKDSEFVDAKAYLLRALFELSDLPNHPLRSYRPEIKELFEQLDDIETARGSVNMARAIWHDRSGDYLSALTEYRLSSARAPSSRFVLERIYHIIEALDYRDEAPGLARTLDWLNPLDTELAETLGRDALKLGDIQLAKVLLERSSTETSSTEQSNYLGHLYYLLGDCDTAQQHYARAAELDPESRVPVTFQNLDFEQGIEGWTASNPELPIEYDENERVSGDRSFALRNADADERTFLRISQSIRPCEFRGQWVRISVHVRSEGEQGKVLPYVWGTAYRRRDRVGPGRTVVDEDLSDAAISGDTPWTQYETYVRLPDNIFILALGVTFSKPGNFWVDDWALEVVDGPPPMAPNSP